VVLLKGGASALRIYEETVYGDNVIADGIVRSRPLGACFFAFAVRTIVSLTTTTGCPESPWSAAGPVMKLKCAKQVNRLK
jgi:hypothetical protein